MRKFLSNTLSIFIVAFLLCISVSSAFAAEEVSVNGTAVKPGDTVTYTVKINDLKSSVSAVNVTVEYSDTNFELIAGDDENSAIVFGSKLESVVYNEALQNRFLFNAANGVSGFDFSKDNTVLSLSFVVKDTVEATADISFMFTEIYDMDGKELTENKDYTLEKTTEVNVYNGNKQTVDKTKPSINQSTNSAINQTGDVSPDASIKVTDADDKEASQSNTMIIIVSIVIATIVIAIILILIFVKKPGKE